MVVEARFLAPEVKYFRIEAPKVARKRHAGQFVIVRVDAAGERIPLTIADADPQAGWIAIIVQGVGKTTRTLNRLEVGDVIEDLAGPLGAPSAIPTGRSVVALGGGVGTAITYPTAVALAAANNTVTAIIGGRTKDLVILESEMRAVCTRVYATTDDGSYGYHGFVTDKFTDLLEADSQIDYVVAAGPVPMMRAVAEVTRPLGIKTVVSLNPIMVDGTGMCGGCRVAIGGETRFACVDGPEFDAHLVDFALLDRRNRTYRAFEYYRNEELADPIDCARGAS